MTDIPVEPPSEATPVDVDTGALAETLAVAVEDEREPLTLRQAKVDAVSPGVAEANVCTVRVGNGAPIANVRYLGEAPDVGDSVWLQTNGPDRLVLPPLGRGVPVGVIMAIGGTGGAPAGWWPCDGRSTSGYPKLAARYGANIPNLADRFILGSGAAAVGATGGLATVTDLPAHTHALNNHQHTQTSHSHSGFNHNHSVPDHSHPQVVTAAVGGPGVRADYQSDASSGTFPQGVNTGGSGTLTTGTDGSAYSTGTGGGGLTGNDGGGGQVASAGTGGGVENRPPFYALLWIIKFG